MSRISAPQAGRGRNQRCTRRRWLFGAALPVASGLTACMPWQPSPPTPSQRPPAAGRIEWWADPTPGRLAIAAAWSSAHPETPLAVVPPPEQPHQWPEQAMLAAFAAGPGPAVVSIRAEAVTAFALSGAVASLDAPVRRSGYDLKAFMPSALQPCYGLDGHLYALPEEFEAAVLLFHRQFLHDAGIAYQDEGLDYRQPGSTWESFRRLATELTRWFGAERWGFDPSDRYSSLDIWCWQNGGRIVSDDGRRATLTQPANVDALEWLTSWVRDQGGPKTLRQMQATWGTDGTHPFLTGRLFALHATNRFLNHLARYQPDHSVGAAPLPVRRAAALPLTRSSGTVIGLAAGNAAASAWEVARFLVAHESSAISDQADAAAAARDGWRWLPPYRGQLPLDRYQLATRPSGHDWLDALNLQGLQQARAARFPTRNPAPWAIAAALRTAAREATLGRTTELSALHDAQLRAQRALDAAWRALPPSTGRG